MDFKFNIGDLVMYAGDEEWELGNISPYIGRGPKFGKIYEITDRQYDYADIPDRQSLIRSGERYKTNIYKLKIDNHNRWWVREEVTIPIKQKTD
jgi:hypothetical protein